MNRAYIGTIIFSLMILGITSEAVMATSLDDIIYTCEGQLCSSKADAGRKSSCTESNIEYDSPAWSPDGQAIVTGSLDVDGTSALLMLQADGTLVSKVEKSSGFAHPVWSADGKFVYAVNRDLGATLGRWDKNGKNFLRIPVRGIPSQGTVGPFKYIEKISFSPDGRSISILAEGFNKILIAEFKNDAIKVASQFPEGYASVGMSAWLDEKRLLFVGNKDDRCADLWQLNILDGSVQIKETPGLLIRDSFALSPDKKSIVISGISEDNKTDIRWNLWHYDFPSSTLTKLTSGTEDLSPDWRR